MSVKTGQAHFLSDRPSAREEYRYGVASLAGGMSERARTHIGAARARGHDSDEVRFHHVLAILSDRNVRDISPGERSTLDAIRNVVSPGARDPWAEGIHVIFQLLDAAEDPEADGGAAIMRFDSLEELQKGKILRHLEIFVQGTLQDDLWRRERERVEGERMAGEREQRAWKFFQPAPAGPRVRWPVRPGVSAARWSAVAVTSALLTGACGAIGWVVVRSWAVAAFWPALAGGCLSAIAAVRWRHLSQLRSAYEGAFRPVPKGSFAEGVDKLFSHYFTRYVPDGANRDTWMAQTEGIRCHLRDELVDAYAGQEPVTAEAVAWLIRHRVYQVKAQWRRGGLDGYWERFRVSSGVRAGMAIGLPVLVLAGLASVAGAALADPLVAVLAVAVAAASGMIAVPGWVEIAAERLRYQAEAKESRERLSETTRAYERWYQRLADKPEDAQMAAWLDCDRKVLIDKALRQYALAPSQVITHAVLEAPGIRYEKRASVPKGPWRYTRYHLLVFLLTLDGVRQMSADLDMFKGTFHEITRMNYRFDAVAAVRVLESDDRERTFELGLVSGMKVLVRVTESSGDELEDSEDAESVSEATTDAAGLANTIDVLEGVAAEGKQWLGRRPQRRRHQQREPGATPG